jgi:hypothetical protein
MLEEWLSWWYQLAVCRFGSLRIKYLIGCYQLLGNAPLFGVNLPKVGSEATTLQPKTNKGLTKAPQNQLHLTCKNANINGKTRGGESHSHLAFRWLIAMSIS